MNKFLGHICLLLGCILAFGAAGCQKDDEFDHPNSERTDSNTPGSREAFSETRRVLLVYSCGFNSLSSYLLGDISDLLDGQIPGTERNDDVLLVYGHHLSTTYADPSSPVLFRAYEEEGRLVRDTLQVWPAGTVSADSDNLKEVLTYVQSNFAAKEYHLLFSSHATGWLPASFYTFDTGGKEYIVNAACELPLGYWSEGPFNMEERVLADGEPLTKTLGETRFGTSNNYKVYVMDLQKFADSIPMHLGSILFDCCLMGCVEVAYELKDVCDYLVVSPAEVLADGFNYSVLWEHLFGGGDTDVQAVAEDYFAQYESLSGDSRSATVTMVDCSHMDELATVCKEIFAEHRSGIAALKDGDVQQYHRYDFNCFYDLRDIVEKGGATQGQLDSLDAALALCVPYKAATSSFMPNYYGFQINTYCGLSCYLPSEGGETLDAVYGPLDWNVATGLLE